MFPLFITRCLHFRHDVRDPSGGSGNCGRECCPVIFPKFPRHAANLRHGTDGFTSPPKEGVLRNFSALKIRRLRPGLNPRTWVLKASTLLLDHRSRRFNYQNQNLSLTSFWWYNVLKRTIFLNKACPALYGITIQLQGLISILNLSEIINLH